MTFFDFFTPPFRQRGINLFFTKKIYSILRRIVPSIRERHRLEYLIGPFGYWDTIQKYLFNFLNERGLKPEHKLLDIGCGPLSGGLAFISYLHSGNYVGVDIRKDSVEEALLQIVKADLAHKNPLVIVSDCFGEDELNGHYFDYILASQIMYHLDHSLVRKLFKLLKKLTKSGSKFYCDIIGFPNKVCQESHWNGFRFHLHTIEQIKSIGEKHGFTMNHLGRIEQFGYPTDVNLKTNEMLEFIRM